MYKHIELFVGTYLERNSVWDTRKHLKHIWCVLGEGVCRCLGPGREGVPKLDWPGDLKSKQIWNTLQILNVTLLGICSHEYFGMFRNLGSYWIPSDARWQSFCRSSMVGPLQSWTDRRNHAISFWYHSISMHFLSWHAGFSSFSCQGSCLAHLSHSDTRSGSVSLTTQETSLQRLILTLLTLPTLGVGRFVWFCLHRVLSSVTWRDMIHMILWFSAPHQPPALCQSSKASTVVMFLVATLLFLGSESVGRVRVRLSRPGQTGPKRRLSETRETKPKKCWSPTESCTT